MEARDWVLVFGAVATVLSAYLAARVGGRASVEVARVTARVEERKAAAVEFTAVTERLEAALARSDQQAQELARELADTRRELTAERVQREHEREADRAVRTIHAGWDWTAYNLAHEHGLAITPPPPLLALVEHHTHPATREGTT